MKLDVGWENPIPRNHVFNTPHICGLQKDVMILSSPSRTRVKKGGETGVFHMRRTGHFGLTNNGDGDSGYFGDGFEMVLRWFYHGG